MKILFLGGPKDGEWIEVSADRQSRPIENWYSVPVPGSLNSIPSRARANLSEITYFLTRIADTDDTYVYVYRSSRSRGVIRELVEGYRKPSP